MNESAFPDSVFSRRQVTDVNTERPGLNGSIESAIVVGKPHEICHGPNFAIFFHAACQLHNIPGHVEQPSRTEKILDELKKRWDPKYFREAPLVTEKQILGFHSKSHLEMLEKKFLKVQGRKEIVSVDGDTQIMQRTKEAAYRAAGSVIAAVDGLFLLSDDPRKLVSAFCCVRPPGHHAERNRACGFCLLSNAAIAAKHAQSEYGVKRVAVLDFDVHHGNGTEEGFRVDNNLFYGSTHEKDNFPGTGSEPTLKGESAVKEEDRRIVNRYMNPRGPRGESVSIRQEFRTKWTEIIAEMERWGRGEGNGEGEDGKLGLVIISAGFDAHDEDPLADCDLQEDDFEWATTMVTDSCLRLSPSAPIPCISVLEGGYDLSALASSAGVHVSALYAGAMNNAAEAAAAAATVMLSPLAAECCEENAPSDGSLKDVNSAPDELEVVIEGITCIDVNDR